MLNTPDLSNEMRDFTNNFSINPDNFTPAYWESDDNPELQKFKKFVKDFYRKKQKYTCAYCRQKFVVDNNASWDLDHIVPKNIKPEWMLTLNNLCITCKDCNNSKSNKNTISNKKLKKYPKNEKSFVIFHPHFEEYDTHINVVSEGEFYFPRTEKGLKTYDYCGLSRFFLKLAGIENCTNGYDALMLRVVTQITNTEDANMRASLFGLLSGLIDKATKANSVKQLDEILKRN